MDDCRGGNSSERCLQGIPYAHPATSPAYSRDLDPRPNVCVSLLIASSATDMQVAHRMGYSNVETIENIYGHLFARDRASVLEAMNQAVSHLYAYESCEPGPGGDEDATARAPANGVVAHGLAGWSFQGVNPL